MEEIVVNFFYEMICLIDCILGFIWNCFYQGINVYNVECVCQLVYDGYELVYVFCYCSYMDYLLFFYVLYYQGLVLLYIVVGINLNFWLVGLIFCCLGVFFICCIFKGNKFYFIVFCEYFGELFSCGYFVEYFVEGGCFCMGCLLDLKIGMLLMIIQVMLCGGMCLIMLILIYIGYEYVMEVGIYVKELCGVMKEKESLLQMLCGLSKLCNFGQGYVNFGELMLLMIYFNQYVLDWCEFIDFIEVVCLVWLMLMVNNIVVDLMVCINNVGVVNVMNLCCIVFLVLCQCLFICEQLIE